MLPASDIALLRELAKKVAELAADPVNDAKRELWYRHTDLKGGRPPLFISPEGSWEEILHQSRLRCVSDEGKRLENDLMQRILRAELIRDDVPIERTIPVPICVVPVNHGWGMELERTASSVSRGAWNYKPVVEKPSDWKRLKRPKLEVDEEGVRRKVMTLQEAIGDILDVEMTGCTGFSFHMMHCYCDFRGLTNMMMDLVLEPGMVHEVISFFAEGLQEYIDQIKAANLIALNNRGQYHYTGGLGYTNDLPKEWFDPQKVRFDDVWAAAEAQEFAQVSPEMHEEFILQYERKLLANFGMNGYGCCDDLTRKLPNVLKIKNLRRVGISPWADIEKCADQLGKDYLLTWKPQPSYLAAEQFDDEFVQKYLTESLKKSAHANVEIILRDTHTCRNEPGRFLRFRNCAYGAIEEVYDCQIPWK